MKQTKLEMLYSISQNDEKSEANVYIFGDITSWPMIETETTEPQAPPGTTTQETDGSDDKGSEADT